MKKLTVLILAASLVGCATVSKQVGDGSLLEDFPTKPQIGLYTKAPVVKTLPDGNYEVTPEMVDHAVLLEKYSKNIDTWKARNSIHWTLYRPLTLSLLKSVA